MQINRKDADDFSQSWSLNPPNIPVEVAADSRISDFNDNLQHPLAIEGIEVDDSQMSADTIPKIMITRSLASNSRSKCLCNACLCGFLVSYLYITLTCPS